MDPNIKEIKKTILNNTESIHEQINIDIQELRLAAADFLNQLEQIYFNASLTTTSNQDKEKMRLWKIYTDDETAQAIALAQHNFSIKLDKFLKRRIILTYVTQDGQILFYDEKQEKEILKTVQKNKGRQNLPQNAWSTQKKQINEQSFTDEEKELLKHINNEVKEKQKVYQVALERYNETKQERNEKKYYWKRTYKSLKRVYTETEFSIGEMAEGYVTAIVAGKKNKFSSPKDEKNVETPLRQLYNNYIKSQKDSLGAIVSGDVVLTPDGKISLAVKSGSASTAMVGQYIVAAYQILNQSDLTEKDISEKWLAKLPKINILADRIYQESGEELEIYLKKWLTEKLNLIQNSKNLTF